VDILLQNEGFVPYYLFDEVRFIHRDIRDCHDRGLVSRIRNSFSVLTPLGEFSECLEFSFNLPCSDYGREIEDWCPGVGLVRFIDTQSEYVLRRLERGPGPQLRPFLRGDSNQSGSVDISDGIAILNFLFLGSAGLACLEAGDADDTGTLVITDAIGLFQFLFLEGAEPHPPGPRECGLDPSADDLSCEEFGRCP
jgi:hypothetical protein